MMTEVLAIELGPHGIRVNAVLPGLILDDVVTAENAEQHPYVNMMLKGTPLGRTGASGRRGRSGGVPRLRPRRLDHRRDAGSHRRLALRPHPHAVSRSNCGDAMSEFVIVGAGAIGAIVGVALIGAGHAVRFIEANRAIMSTAMRAGGLRLSGYRRGADRRADLRRRRRRIGRCGRCCSRSSRRHTLEALRRSPAASRRTASSSRCRTASRNTASPTLVGARAHDRRVPDIRRPLQGAGRNRVTAGPAPSGSARSTARRRRASPRCSEAFSALQPVEVTDNIFGFLWSKIALGAIYFATATTNSDVTDLYAVARYRDAVRPSRRRGRRGRGGAGRAAGDIRRLRPDGVSAGRGAGPGRDRRRLGRARTATGTATKNKRTGIWRDLAIHKRKTEVDRLIGPVIEIGTRARRRDARAFPARRHRQGDRERRAAARLAQSRCDRKWLIGCVVTAPGR